MPLAIGFVWYHPKVLGNVWMNASGVMPDMGKSGNMPLIFGVTFLLSFLLSFGLQFMVIHQMHIGSIFLGMENADTMTKDFLDKYGHQYRTFKHGVFHGVEFAILLALPVLGVNALHERKGFKYIAINVGFWIVCFALMGGILCQWA